jgi:phosphonate transport system substrate-binding protein
MAKSLTLFASGRLWAPLIVLAASLAWTPAPLAADPPDNPVYTFGIVPQQSATELARTWGPVLNALQAKSGLTLRFATAPDIPTFEQRLAAGEYDFAYMNPYHYTVFHQRPGYAVFAKEKDRLLKGIVVIRKDAPFAQLADLAGETLIFPAPAAFAATVLVRAALSQQGIAITPKFVASHDSVYLSVAKGLYPAGGGVTRTFESLDPAVRDALRILWTTEGYTPHAIAAHPRIPAAVVERLRDAMLGLDGDPEVQAALEGIRFKGIAAARDADYDDVRALRIDLLDTLAE